jgi:peptidoglycan/LPS O-acetylase OafA/YrhL
MDVQINYGISWQQRFYHLDGFGCIGVDLFFVISGFIITYVAGKYLGIDEGLFFVEKRFWRINPVYFIATLVCLGVNLLQMTITHTMTSSPIIKIIGSLFDTLLIVPYSESIRSFKPLLIVGWTLSFEWLFYIIFFLLIAGNVRRKTIALLIIFILLISAGQLINPRDLRLQFLTNPILLEFLLGVLICHLYTKGAKIPVWTAIFCLSIGLVSYMSLIRFGYGNVWYYLGTINGKASLHKFLIWGIPSACVMFGFVFLEKNGLFRRLFDNKLSLLFGDASYSIYLIHYTVFNALPLIYSKTGFFLQPDVMIWLQVIFGVGISLLFYKWVEKPLLRCLHNKTKPIIKKKETQPAVSLPNPAP